MRNRPAFTLIELLVTLGIIGILLGAILPAFSRMRSVSKSVGCSTQLAQTAIAVQTYCDDYNGAFPSFFFDVSPGNSGNVNVMLKPKRATASGLNYFPESLRVCPEDEQPSLVPVKLDDGSSGTTAISYGYNIEMVARNVKDWQLASYDVTSTFAIFWDGRIDVGNGGKPAHYTSTYEFATRTFAPRHHGGSRGNVLYFDGHVEDSRVQLLLEEVSLDAQ